MTPGIVPFQSFFHILIHNSQFCTRWIDEDMHVINWDLNRGCSCQKHIDAIDWCGCSPMVIKQRDFAEMSEVKTHI